jgi:hypothetical protein
MLIPPLLLGLLLSAGCGSDATIAAAVSVGSFPILHRSPPDVVISALTGRDCSVVNLDKGERYCRPKELPLEPPVFCSRSLGVPDCWAEPDKLPNKPREIADGPRVLTPAQETERTKRWPGLW